MNYKLEIEKIAKSYDARRKKQYQQILKRLYGGNENMMEELSKSRDFNIYHGTRKDMMDSISKDGLNAGPYREFGKGVFFGDKKTSGYYSKPELMSGGIPVNHVGFNPETASKEEINKILKEYPDYKISKGERVRIARPSELKGTKTLYPDVNKAMVFDIDKDKGFRSVGTHLEYQMDIPYRKRKKLLAEAKKLPYEEKYKKVKELGEEVYGRKGLKLEKHMEMYKKYPEFIDDDYVNDMHRKKVYDRFTPKNKKEFNQMKYYGQSREGRLFDNGIVSDKGTRNEFFFKQDNFPPELLRKEDGTKLTDKRITSTKGYGDVLKDKSMPTKDYKNVIKDNVIKEKSISTKGLSRNAKIGLGIGAGALALGAGAYGIKKLRDKRKEEVAI